MRDFAHSRLNRSKLELRASQKCRAFRPMCRVLSDGVLPPPVQSSLNADQGMGVASLSIIYASMIVSSMFIAPIMIKNLGCKWSVVVGMVCYVSYSLGNLYPGW